MPIETWLAFSLACMVVLAIPGPTVMMVLGFALSQGRRSAIASVLGVMLGDAVAMTISLAGLGAILATSATLFSVLKFCGAAYLLWLGIQMWRSGGKLGEVARMDEISKIKIFRDTFFVTVLNPKGMVFFVAFLPQFITPNAALLPQFGIMELTFVGLGGLNVVFWVAMAGGMRRFFATPGMMKRVNRIGGTGLIGAGLVTALSGQTSS